jgi:hypothetical protein
MGIRIKKRMGYSLSLKQLNDLGIYTDMSWAHNDFLEDTDKWNLMCDEIISVAKEYKDRKDNPFFMESMYLKMSKEKSDEDISSDYSLRKLKGGEFYQYITYDDEFGDEDTILFQPLVCGENWSRYDDAIDYVEASLDETLMGPKVIRHNRTLYPFINLMRKNEESYLGIEQYWEPCYLDKSDFKSAVPTCTYGVMIILKYMEIVSPENLADTIMTLKPTIYSYWS